MPKSVCVGGGHRPTCAPTPLLKVGAHPLLLRPWADTLSTSSLKPLNVICRNLTGIKKSTSSIKFVVLGGAEKTRWPPLPLIGRDIFWLLWNCGICRNLTGSKISTSSTKFVFFRPMGKTRWPPWLRHFRLFLWNRWTKLDRKQNLNVLYYVCVFGPMGKTR